jgi:hypothetical protein
LAERWARDPTRPKIRSAVSKHWESLVSHWADGETLPLYVRKASGNRGSEVVHSSGRIIVPVDNSPAQWAFALALLGEVPSIEDVRLAIQGDRIPVAMVLKASERKASRFKCVLSQVANPNAAGWKVAHVRAIGLRDRTDVRHISEATLRQHFLQFMTPSNMFVVPLRYAGLAEIPEFCTVMGSYRESNFPEHSATDGQGDVIIA